MMFDYRSHRYRGGSRWLSRGFVSVAVGITVVTAPTIDGIEVTAQACAKMSVSAEASASPTVTSEACAMPSVSSESAS